MARCGPRRGTNLDLVAFDLNITHPAQRSTQALTTTQPGTRTVLDWMAKAGLRDSAGSVMTWQFCFCFPYMDRVDSPRIRQMDDAVPTVHKYYLPLEARAAMAAGVASASRLAGLLGCVYACRFLPKANRPYPSWVCTLKP
ncbi:uncharacterized protein TRIVIDRAFT_60682 [Trichoderma virens Gv29-8]|uniref:Uncharacterized protein n=1 Tax=Hypocrea virens (strain Gv29-8 / FGSC 10586) TaxID=413071 RepID=G9MQT3_HYPVG|nr:uncharacterized protein TRIVIDRAFT_60682 [Trichoderma virens Gv29-8]EHK22462.1 hypothetical protein TRIVIDRAFT_60682 [Trichoderma virens Gv29-8]UKZ47503.1 hypothetical protein TrVGV298_001722 [Trichoderma virens]